jgi:Cu+-exporting ATPase
MAQTLQSRRPSGSTGRSGADLSAGATACAHCGDPCGPAAEEEDGRAFCCAGCRTVFLLLQESGLGDFYRLSERPGTRLREAPNPERWGFLDDPDVARRLLDYQDARIARVAFHLPAIHCVACVWLLENLFRLHPGVGRSRVDFARREVAITYAPERITLSALAGLLERIGYPPELTLAELDRPERAPRRKLGLQIGVAGFAFGNIMLFSLPLYMGLDSLSGPAFRALFGGLSLVLALPALIYSASDYWRSAAASLRQRALTLDVPIAAGLAALYAQSAWEILSGVGPGYLDSLAGLIFFLLCGRAFQQKTHDRLGFDRDYRGFFPLSVTRRTPGGEETVAISRVEVGDRLLVRHGELAPADAILISGDGLMDYSFVTGEAEPVTVRPGDRVYAGGRQAGGRIEIETVKPVSQSYLTSLWNEDAFRKQRDRGFESLTNRYSRRFTVIVMTIAAGAWLGWALAGDAGRGLKAFTSVLIVACPCALALAAPFTLGAAQRLLGRRGIFLRNSQVLETMAEIDAIALDKTGTLTEAEGVGAQWDGEPLSPEESELLAGLCCQSAHPHARRIARALQGEEPAAEARPLDGFVEVPGQGMAAGEGERRVVAGSRDWLALQGIAAPPAAGGRRAGSAVWVAMGGRCRGVFTLENRLRPEMDSVLPELARAHEVWLLSGDNDRERERFADLLGDASRLRFHQSPHDKLRAVKALQEQGRKVLMVGDGLNDAGALSQGDVGIAVVEAVGRFSPASDVIMEARTARHLGRLLDFSRRVARVVRAGFALSAAYNVVGVSIAAAGVLSPVICAILMPISSVSVVLWAVGATRREARRSGIPKVEAEGA